MQSGPMRYQSQKAKKERKTSDCTGSQQEGVGLGGDLQAGGVRGDGWMGGRAPHAL